MSTAALWSSVPVVSVEFNLCQPFNLSSTQSCPHCGLLIPLSNSLQVRLPAVLFLLGVGSLVAYRLYSFMYTDKEKRRKPNKSISRLKDINEKVKQCHPSPILPGLNWSALAEITQTTVNSECSVESIDLLLKRLQAEHQQCVLDTSAILTAHDTTPKVIGDSDLNNSAIFQGGTICKLNRLLGELNQVKQSCAEIDDKLHQVQDKPQPTVAPPHAHVEADLTFGSLNESIKSFHLSDMSKLDSDFSFNVSDIELKLNENRMNSTEQNMAWLMADDTCMSTKLPSFLDSFGSTVGPEAKVNVRPDRLAGNTSFVQDKQNQTSDGESEQEDEWPFESNHGHSGGLVTQAGGDTALSIANEEATLEWDSTDVVLFNQDEPDELLFSKSILDAQSDHSLADLNQSMQSSLTSIEQAREDNCWSALQLSAEQQQLLSKLSGRFNQHQRRLIHRSSDGSSSVCSEDSELSHEKSLQILIQEAKKQGLVRELLIRLSQFEEIE